MSQIDFEQLERLLVTKEFDTSSVDNVLTASKETGDTAIEITIDSSGGCLVKKTLIGKQSSKQIEFENQKISKISFNSKISQIRVKLTSENNLLAVLKLISTPLF